MIRVQTLGDNRQLGVNKQLILRLNNGPPSNIPGEENWSLEKICQSQRQSVSGICLPNKEKLVLRLRYPVSTDSEPFGRTDSEPFGRTDSEPFGRTTGGPFDFNNIIDDSRIWESSLKAAHNSSDPFGRSSSESFDYDTCAAQESPDFISAELIEFFKEWHIDNERTHRGRRVITLADDDIDVPSFAAILIKNPCPRYPELHDGEKLISDRVVADIDINNLFDSAMKGDRAYYKDLPADAAKSSDEVQSELDLLTSFLGHLSSSDMKNDASRGLESYVGQEIAESIAEDIESRKEAIADQLQIRLKLLKSLQIKVILPLLCLFDSRHNGCVFPVGMFYNLLNKIDFAKHLAMKLSIFGNSSIFTTEEKEMVFALQEKNRRGAAAFAEQAYEEYESEWDVYAQDIMLQGFMPVSESLTHTQLYTLFEYRESLLADLHAKLYALSLAINNTLPKK